MNVKSFISWSTVINRLTVLFLLSLPGCCNLIQNIQNFFLIISIPLPHPLNWFHRKSLIRCCLFLKCGDRYKLMMLLIIKKSHNFIIFKIVKYCPLFFIFRNIKPCYKQVQKYSKQIHFIIPIEKGSSLIHLPYFSSHLLIMIDLSELIHTHLKVLPTPET